MCMRVFEGECVYMSEDMCEWVRVWVQVCICRSVCEVCANVGVCERVSGECVHTRMCGSRCVDVHKDMNVYVYMRERVCEGVDKGA